MTLAKAVSSTTTTTPTRDADARATTRARLERRAPRMTPARALRARFVAVGVGTLFPWNVFITERAYFARRFANDGASDGSFFAREFRRDVRERVRAEQSDRMRGVGEMGGRARRGDGFASDGERAGNRGGRDMDVWGRRGRGTGENGRRVRADARE